jgi:hypothetical protein
MPKKVKQLKYKVKEIKITLKTKNKVQYIKVFIDDKEVKDFRNFIIKGYPHELTMELNYWNPFDFNSNFFQF